MNKGQNATFENFFYWHLQANSPFQKIVEYIYTNQQKVKFHKKSPIGTSGVNKGTTGPLLFLYFFLSTYRGYLY